MKPKQLKALLEVLESSPPVLTMTNVAQLLGRHRNRIHVFIKEGRLKAQKNEIHNAYEIQKDDLRKFIVKDFAKASPGRKKGCKMGDRRKVAPEVQPVGKAICMERDRD
ncbi:MAG TPA: helix-turn-helix domain-containing protein [Cyanophyceae cyanobacterium]